MKGRKNCLRAVLCSDVFCHVAVISEHIFAASSMCQSVAGALSGVTKVAEFGCGLLAKDASIHPSLLGLRSQNVECGNATFDPF